ncbi:HtaA domain-containing protein [Streptomyces sp. NPDC020965]|uniref:HtaA domain-containing protein n=1 Tax=Streptomyces sp. NPDC020965 TaxID=3365105 RepID=UPI0037A065E3
MTANRRSLSIAAAAATAAAFGATALALPAVAAASSPAAAGATADQATSSAAGATTIGLKDGTLEWGFKGTFRKYVKAKNISVADGAKQAPDNGPFTFTGGTGTYDTKSHGTSTAFQGSVLFNSAHFTMEFADVKMVTNRTSGSITADVTLDGELHPDLAIAALDMTKATRGGGEGGAMVFSAIPASITAEGGPVLNYPEGEVLDTATLSVKADGGGRPDPGKDPETDPGKDPEKDPEKDPNKDPEKEPEKDPGKEPGKDPEKDPVKEPEKDPVKEPDAAVNGAIVDGNLDWGVMKRFREYVVGNFAKGKAELAGGAVKSGEGYRFPKGKGSYDAAKDSLSVSFDGSVRFLGHLSQGVYGLDLKLSDIKVKATGTKGTLYVDVNTKSKDTGKPLNYNDVAFGSLSLPAGALKPVNKTVKLTAVPGTLTAEGRKVFENQYDLGEPLDAVTVAAALDKGVPLPPGGTGGTTGGTNGGTTGGSTNGGTTGGSVGGTVGGGSLGSGSVGGGSVGGTTGSVGGPADGSVGGALASTGAGLPTTALLAASAGIAAAGAGVVFAVRRRGATTEF